MKLVLGGYAQGKLQFVREKYMFSGSPQEYDLWENAVWDGSKGMLPAAETAKERPVVINHFHEWVKSRIRDGGHPEDEIQRFLEKCEACIIICDEVGNGIVPADAFEREYRERTGRILIELAKQAEEVIRVICGIGQKIK